MRTIRFLFLAAVATVLTLKVSVWYESYQREQHERDLASVVLSHLGQPAFSSADLLEQVCKVKGELELHELDEGKVYFSVPRSSFSQKETVAKLTRNPERVEFAKEEGGAAHLGDYKLHKADVIFFRFPDEDFWVDPRVQVTVKYQAADYTITLDELADFIENKSVYGGPPRYYKEWLGDIPVFKANMGSCVGKRGEPSLRRFVDQLLNGEQRPEAIAQKLLDFVTAEIPYDHVEKELDVQTMKRPSEVLLTRTSACANKAILLASLLEQTAVDYVLLYSPKHATIAVAGEYHATNGLVYEIVGRRYTLAEPTARGFVIGQSIVEMPVVQPENLEFAQWPAQGRLVNLKTGQPVKFNDD